MTDQGWPTGLGPWTLIDSPLGWAHRSAVVELVHAIEEARSASEARAAAARHEAEVARWERDRLAGRRSVRLVTELLEARHGPVGQVPARLRAALEPRSAGPRPGAAPAAPAPPPLPDVLRHAAVDGLRRSTLLGEDQPRHLHLRVLHLGVAARFAGQAPHTVVDPDGWREQLDEGWDLLIVEPGAASWDPTGGDLPGLLEAARGAGIPSVRVWPPGVDGDLGPGRADHEVREGPGGELPATVDSGTFNPVGWHPTPPDPVVVVPEVAPAGRVLDLLAAFDPPVLARHPADVDLGDALRRQEASADPRAHARSLRRAGVVLDHASLHATATDMRRAWAAALACGTPVLALEPEDADDLPPGVVPVAAAEAVEVAHRFLVDPDHRERVSITGRRHALLDASRDRAFRDLLDLVGLPVPAGPRTTVVMATHRVDFLDHALASVRRQTQPDVDLVLVLHGDAFDGVDVPARDLALSEVVRAPSEWVLGDCLNAGLDRAGGDLIAKMDDDDHYGPEHLRDLVLAQRYSGADVVGKRIEFVHLTERDVTLRRMRSRPERDRPHVGGPTLLGTREVLRQLRFLHLPSQVDSTLYRRLLAAGGRLYRTHSRDVVLSRHGEGHAWERDDQGFLDEAIESRPGLDLGLASSAPSQPDEG